MAFLKDKKSLFVGINVGNDLNIVGQDFEQPFLKDQVNFLELGMMARNRDVVQHANHSCADIVAKVLGFKLNKQGPKCSVFSVVPSLIFKSAVTVCCP